MASAVNLEGVGIILPILSFLLVFIISFVIMNKSKIIQNKVVELLISIILATIFVASLGPREYVTFIVPGFAILIVLLFMIMAVSGFVGVGDKFGKNIGKGFIIILIIFFFIAGLFVFSAHLEPYLPNAQDDGTHNVLKSFLNWIYTPKIAGAILLIIAGLVVSWILIKKS